MYPELLSKKEEVAGFLHLDLLDEAETSLAELQEALSDAEADKDPDASSTELRRRVDELRLDLEMRRRHFPIVDKLAAEFIAQYPSFTQGYFHRGYALHEMGKTAEALGVLLEMPAPSDPWEKTLRSYNLACYYAVLGDLPLAKDALFKAISAEPSYRKQALDDPDLLNLEPWLESLQD